MNLQNFMLKFQAVAEKTAIKL